MCQYFLGSQHSFCEIHPYGVEVKLMNLISSILMTSIE